MPLPYLEALCKRRRRTLARLQERLALNYLVLVLDWLAMGEKLVDVSCIGLGSPLNSKQWEVVRRLAPLVRQWVDHEEVDSAAMGRSAAKMETVEDAISALEEAFIQPARELRNYLGKTMPGPQRDWGQVGHPGEVVGRVDTQIEHVAKDVEPHRYFFHDEPSFDAQKFLDDENRAKYLSPFAFAKQMDADSSELPSVKVRGSRNNKMKLLEKLDASKRLKLLPAGQIARGFENGLFSIPKDSEKDRMVLDARRPNSREEAEKRWIQSLGAVSQLSHVFLSSSEVLLLHAEDLRDFYHAFQVSEQRTARNALKMLVRPSQVEHLSCFEDKMRQEALLVPCLATLAMGDLNAVAFGQTSHLAVILRTQELKVADFLGLKMRPSRKRVRAGLMIDDFVIFETIKKEELEELRGKPSPGAEVVAKIRTAYDDVGLPRHSGKAVEQALKGECWGMEIDGSAGVVRPSLKRVIPLSNIILQLVQLGKASVGLLELVAGALCSVFQVRRRLMASLHEIYAAQRGRDRRDVVAMSSQLKDELMMSLALMMVSVIDMRLEPGEWLVATDASSTTEAGVACRVGKQRMQEFQRYALQKGLWNRLVSPTRAYLRERAELGEDEELPEELEYNMPPLWQEIVETQAFEPFGKPEVKKKREHINLKEISASLKAETRYGRQWPSSYFVNLQDSQVSLAALVKGRSSSWSINQKLRKSIPNHLGFNTRPFYGFVRSKYNPGDDPTRRVPLRAPAKEEPTWWEPIGQGNFSEFDQFLERVGARVEDMAGLPPEEELLETWDFDFRTNKQLKAERGKRMGSSRRFCETEEAVKDPEEDRRAEAAEEAAGEAAGVEENATAAGDEGEVGGVTEDAKLAEAESSEAAGKAGDDDAGKDEAERKIEAEGARQRLCAEQEADRADRRKTGGGRVAELDEQAKKDHRKDEQWQQIKEELLQFPEDQFVYGKQCPNLAAALAAGPGLLDLFSGARGFARSFVRRGAPWAFCWDLRHSLREDLLSPCNQRTLLSLLRRGSFLAMAAGPVCASFSTAITPAWRTKEYPGGIPGLREDQLLKISMGHAQLRFVLQLCQECLKRGVHFWIENPDSSWFWKQPGALSWEKILASGRVLDYRTDQCAHGTPWRKRTKFRTTCHLGGQRQMCQCTKPHRLLRGRCKEAGMNWTKVAESYPRQLCEVLACAMARDCGLVGNKRPVNVAAIAKITNSRIGEAANPGPRGGFRIREKSLDEFQLLEPQTIELRSKLWMRFRQWVEEQFGCGSLEGFLAVPIFVAQVVRAYGYAQYNSGAPLHYYRQLLAHLQKELPLTKPFLSSSWSLVSQWELAEPVQHRTPIPEPLLRAAACLALAWGWPSFAATLMAGFYGICRIGEVLRASRRELLTPEDLLSEEQVVYLRILSPKSRNRGPRVQYTKIEDEVAVRLIQTVWQKLHARQQLVVISAASFRRRWDAIMEKLGVEQHHRLTPGSLRGGGAIAAHRRGTPISDLLWRMRIQHQRTLAFYLQETTAVSLLPMLPPHCRDNILCLQRLLPIYVDFWKSRRTTPIVSSAHGFSWLAA